MASQPNKQKQIAIIGAGISGLLACKHSIESGFSPIVFEARNTLGGVWASTIHSTKLQTPKHFFQFSDFPWPDSVPGPFPNHAQVLDYITSYAVHFDVISRIRFNCKVISIDYVSSDHGAVTMPCLDRGEAFSDNGKWNVVVQDVLDPLVTPKVYQVDFVILCIGKFSGLPNMPDFSVSEGIDDVFDGEIMHSMDYAVMDKIEATTFTANKTVAVVGFQKSALDVAAEIAKNNGSKYPCTLIFRRVHWTGSEKLVNFTFKNLTRFSELMVHKPDEGLILCFIAILLSPLRWIFSKLVECYLKWMYPLKEHDMIPDYPFLKQIYSCMFMILPENFYERVKEKSLVLRKSRVLGLCKSGLVLILENVVTRLKADIIIFATGYKSDEKIANIFSSIEFKKCITGSSAPFYRECIHPRIPQLAILGYSESPATLFTFELRSKWIACFLAGKFKLPPVREMEENVKKWEKNARAYSRENYKRACAGVLLQIHCNDQLCRDMGCHPMRKKWLLPQMFSPYQPHDYANL